MERVFNKIIDWLERSGEIKEADRELYLYALKSIFLSLSPIILSLVAGVLLHCPLQSILIILPFAILRKFSGGYHMRSEIACVFLSTIIIVECTMISCYLKKSIMTFFVATGAAVSLICLSPIDHENRRLSREEKRVCRRWTAILVLVIYMADSIFFLMGKSKVSNCLGIGLILVAVLQYPCLLEKMIFHFCEKRYKDFECSNMPEESAGTGVVKGGKKKYNA